MELEVNEINTMILALETAIQHNKELARQSNNDIFIKPDFEILKVKAEKWQRKQSKKPIKIPLNI